MRRDSHSGGGPGDSPVPFSMRIAHVKDELICIAQRDSIQNQ